MYSLEVALDKSALPNALTVNVNVYGETVKNIDPLLNRNYESVGCTTTHRATRSTDSTHIVS